MELNNLAIDEFIKIYREEFGIELSIEEASLKARGLLQLFDCITQEMENIVK